MREHIDPIRFVERVLESDAPVWRLWDGDCAKLISTLALFAQAECSSTKVPTTRATQEHLARLIWLLDRLTPEDDNSTLEPYLASARGVYAWGRRLPPERRNELLTVPLPVESKNWQRTRYVQFLLLAWCDSCPQDQIETLLDWHEHWWPALLLSDHGWLWIWRHSRANWRSLHEYALCNPDERAFERLVEITPDDDLESWDDLLLGRSEDHGEMRAFCRWVQPQFAESLREHFLHSDGDWRTCAFLNYLSKTSEAQLRHLWRGESGMPAWQIRELDRRLFAPKAARPAALLEDRQKILADPRLRDPFTP